MNPMLSFLRPLGLPRISTMNQFFRRSLTTASASTISAPPAVKLAATETSTPNLTYFVRRTSSNSLPVYLLKKRGGNLKQTKIRKIEGDVAALRSELKSALELVDEQIVINQLTKHIIIKVGHLW